MDRLIGKTVALISVVPLKFRPHEPSALSNVEHIKQYVLFINLFAVFCSLVYAIRGPVI
jgi:hypothetical protein